MPSAKFLMFGITAVIFLSVTATELELDKINDLDDPKLTQDHLFLILPKLRFENKKKYVELVKKCLASKNCKQSKSGEIIHPKMGAEYPIGNLIDINRPIDPKAPAK